MNHTPPPPAPRWLWFAAVAGLALLASLTIAAGRDPPTGSQASTEPTHSTSTDDHSSATALDSTAAVHHHRLLLQQPLY